MRAGYYSARPNTYAAPYARPADLAGLKKVFRKIAGPVAAAAAIAAGQPQLAVAAYSVGKSATAKKPKYVAPPVEIPPPQSAGLFSSLPQADRNALLIGGTAVATLLAAKLLLKRK